MLPEFLRPLGISNQFFALIPFLFLAACATPPFHFDSVREGQWRGKALVRDNTEHKSAILNLQIKAAPEQKMRVDVTSPLGSYLATFLMNGENFDYVLTADKTYYKTKTSSASLKNILKIPLEPVVFYQILFDHAPESKTWNCTKDANGFLRTCSDLKSKINITWSDRNGESRTIDIDHPVASLQVHLFQFDNKNADEKSFILKPPVVYKIKNL